MSGKRGEKDIEWSNVYDDGIDFRLVTNRELDRILSFTDDSLPKTNLDLGCGTGQLTRELYHRGYECVGVDVATSAVERAKSATVRSGLQYIQCDLEGDFGELDAIKGKKFSLITTKSVFAFMKDKKAFLLAVSQFLADDGMFVVITPDASTTPAEKQRIAVDRNETFELLEQLFGEVEMFELRNLLYFICKKASR